MVRGTGIEPVPSATGPLVRSQSAVVSTTALTRQLFQRCDLKFSRAPNGGYEVRWTETSLFGQERNVNAPLIFASAPRTGAIDRDFALAERN